MKHAERDVDIAEISDAFLHLKNCFDEMVAEFTSLLVAINGPSFFEDNPEYKAKMAAEAVAILKRKNKMKQIMLITKALEEYCDQY